MKRMKPACSAVFCAAAGVLSAAGFLLPQQGYIGMSDLPPSPASLLWSALALLLGCGYYALYHHKGIRPDGWDIGFGLVFGFLNTFAGLLFAYDSWQMKPAFLLLHLFRSVLQALPMMAFLAWVKGGLSSGTLMTAEVPKQSANRFVSWLSRHDLLSVLLLLFLCYLPYLIVFYPGTVCWDLGEMAAQYFGQRPMDSWHPPFLTYLFGGCLSIGRHFGSDNIGAFLFTLLQTIALCYAFSSAMRFIRSRNVKRGMYLCCLAFFALLPIWGGYAQFISKDTLYTAMLLLFFLAAAKLLLHREKSTPASPLLWAELVIWGCLTALVRSNGIYVVLPTAVLLFFFAAKGQKKWLAALAAAGIAGCFVLFNSVLLPSLGVRDETATGLYSVCFQQSARTLRDHPNEITPEEKQEIDLVLEADRIADLYEPWISDPVKYTFRHYGQGAQQEKAVLSRYRSTWLSMMKKYPLTYAEAFFAGNISYYTFMPKMEGETYNNQAGNRLVFETYDLGDDPRLVHTKQIPALSPLRTVLSALARGIRYLPMAGILYACASYTWTMVAAGLALVKQHRWRMLAACLPALLTLAVCMLSPVNDYFRYFLPVAAMTPPVLSLAGAPKNASDAAEKQSDQGIEQ